MSSEKEPTPTVLAIEQMGFDGHIIPHTWYDHITYKTEKGTEKVDLQAIVILSDIVYWYRPRKIVDEATGRRTGLERRFAADKLQRSYQQIAELFGLSKTQAARAVKRLEGHGLITMEFRTVETASGTLFNVLYLDLVPERLAEITYKRVRTSLQNRKDPPTKTETPPIKKVDTYTENTSENTPKIESKPKPDILDAMLHYSTRDQPENWAVPAAAGGADDWGAAVDAFAGLLSLEPATLPGTTRREWSRVLQKVGNRWKTGPSTVAHVIEQIPESQFHWKTYAGPHSAEQDIGVLIGQFQGGGIQKPKKTSGGNGENRHDRNKRIIERARAKYLLPEDTIDAESITIL